MAVDLGTWSGEGVRLAEVESALAELRATTAREGAQPDLRTSVMTHLAWVPDPWLDRARAALAGMGERHPSRTLILIPEPDAGQGAPCPDEGGKPGVALSLRSVTVRAGGHLILSDVSLDVQPGSQVAIVAGKLLVV